MAAPGVNIASIGPQGAPYSGDGTSQATAIASAAAALVWSKYPNLTASQVVARMVATVDPRSDRSAYGYGILDTYRAVTASVPVSAPDPVAALARPFLRASLARSHPAAAPRPIVHGSRPPGSFSIGSAPRLFAPRVLAGAAIAAGGLVLLVALLIIGLAARRRRRVAAAQSSASPPSAGGQLRTEWSPISDHSPHE
jgi:hypothetical protein